MKIQLCTNCFSSNKIYSEILTLCRNNAFPQITRYIFQVLQVDDIISYAEYFVNHRLIGPLSEQRRHRVLKPV